MIPLCTVSAKLVIFISPGCSVKRRSKGIKAISSFLYPSPRCLQAYCLHPTAWFLGLGIYSGPIFRILEKLPL
jgi:hypothetical protein